jgi:hypothetical protein
MGPYDDSDKPGQDEQTDDELLAPIVPLRQRAEKPGDQAVGVGDKGEGGQDEPFWSVFDLPDDPTQVLDRAERPRADAARGSHASPPETSGVDYGREPVPHERPRRRWDGIDRSRRRRRLLLIGATGPVFAAIVAVAMLATQGSSGGVASGQAFPPTRPGGGEIAEQPGSSVRRQLARSERRHRPRGHKPSAPVARASRRAAVTAPPRRGLASDAEHRAVTGEVRGGGGSASSSSPASTPVCWDADGEGRCAEAEFGFER